MIKLYTVMHTAARRYYDRIQAMHEMVTMMLYMHVYE
jgi:hypothetical protein